MINKVTNNYFLVLFSLMPISIISGSLISMINILFIDISFLILIMINKDYSSLKSKPVKYLFLFYLYLVFNSLMSFDREIGLARNLGFIRMIILFIAFNYFFNQKIFLNKVLYAWSVILFFVVFDVFFESFSGRNILGYGGEEYGRRLVSFFKDEPIVGGYLNAFYLILIGFLYLRFGEKYKNYVIFLSILILLSILLTGERSNLIKAILGISLFYVFFREYQIKHKFYFAIVALLIFFSIIFSSEYLKLRYFDQIKSLVSQDKTYFKHYKSAYNIFKENKFFGVGNKNYRIVACLKFREKADPINTEFGVPSDKPGSHGPKADKLVNQIEYVCTTHPHQVFFELLSEHGIFGTIIIMFLLYKLIFSKLIFNLKELNYIQLGSGIYIILSFLPLIPGGSFFSDYLLTLFIINLSVFYSSSKILNIFNRQ